MALPRRQAPLRIEGQADVGLGQQFLVAHRLGEEVGVSGLQIEHDVEPCCGSRIDPRSDMVERTLHREVAVRAGVGGGNRRDDLKGRDHHLVADPVVVSGNLACPLESGIDGLLAEYAEIVVTRVAVDGDKTATGEEHVTAPRKLKTRHQRRCRGGGSAGRRGGSAGRRGGSAGRRGGGSGRAGDRHHARHGQRERRGDHDTVASPAARRCAGFSTSHRSIRVPTP